MNKRCSDHLVIHLVDVCTCWFFRSLPRSLPYSFGANVERSLPNVTFEAKKIYPEKSTCRYEMGFSSFAVKERGQWIAVARINDSDIRIVGYTTRKRAEKSADQYLSSRRARWP